MAESIFLHWRGIKFTWFDSRFHIKSTREHFATRHLIFYIHSQILIEWFCLCPHHLGFVDEATLLNVLIVKPATSAISLPNFSYHPTTLPPPSSTFYCPKSLNTPLPPLALLPSARPHRARRKAGQNLKVPLSSTHFGKKSGTSTTKTSLKLEEYQKIYYQGESSR